MKDTFAFDLNGQRIELAYTTSNESPLKKVDTGTMTVTVAGAKLGDYPCQKTSFVPFPDVFLPK